MKTFAEVQTKKFSCRRNGKAILALVEAKYLIKILKNKYRNDSEISKLLDNYYLILEPFFIHYKL